MRLIDADAAIEAVCEEVMDRFFVPPSAGYNVAEEALKKLPSIQPDTNCSEIPNSWIPCSERLPEDDTEVLVYLFENNRSPYIAWLSDGQWYTEYFEVEREDEPVAWMPLPEPYQGGEQYGMEK